MSDDVFEDHIAYDRTLKATMKKLRSMFGESSVGLVLFVVRENSPDAVDIATNISEKSALLIVQQTLDAIATKGQHDENLGVINALRSIISDIVNASEPITLDKFQASIKNQINEIQKQIDKP